MKCVICDKIYDEPEYMFCSVECFNVFYDNIESPELIELESLDDFFLDVIKENK